MQEQPIPADNGGRACELCRFAEVVAIDPNTLTKVRTCRRFPPMPLVQVGPNGPGFDMRFPCAQPMVLAKHWCYEFVAEIPDAIKQISHEKSPPKLIQN